LWTADVILPSAGQFTLAVRAEDGGKNILEKELIHIMALTPGTITSQAGATQKATITIYTKDNLTGSFIPWDAAAYGQQNPQKTSEKGTFSFYPPPGTYYLEIHRGFGYSDVVTSTFVTTAAIPISPPIVLPKSPSLTIFGISIPLPSLFRQHISFSLPEEPEPIADIAKETSKVMPEHLFTDIDPSRTFSGHTTHVVLLNTWAPQTPSQIQILEELHVQKPEVNFLVIFPQESKSAIELFAKRGGYTIPLRADPDGTFLEEISYPSIPTFYTMDDKMFLSSQKTGIQPAESL
jgi:hypothetical protein